MPYKLSATLSSHSQDVRAVLCPTENLILSASRDSTAIVWSRDTSQGSSSFTPESILRPGPGWVSAIAYIPPAPNAPHGYVVTGGQQVQDGRQIARDEDRVIKIFPLGEGIKDEPISLIGHTDVVCTLHVGANGVIMSGSWDCTAKIWKNLECTYDLIGHTASVWAVLALDDDQYLTASADKTIKLWKEHKCIHTFTGHTDAVRGLALMPDIGFASCSNDGTVRVWTLAGDIVYTLAASTSFIFCLAILPSGDIVTGGEDRAVSVWRDGELLQKIVHPVISVWAVTSMPNGDIVSGCSDGIVRVFSESEDRWASASDLKTFDDQVANQALPSQTIGDVKKTDVPGLESLAEPGQTPGQVKMVRIGDTVEAHEWDDASSSWKKIGNVVDAVGSSHKVPYEGKEYDYVFDVDIKDGAPPLKLPYNVNENPYGAAQRFLERNDLPLTYVDQVVEFIQNNTAGINLGSGGNDEYVDPFTGASRYRSSANSVPTGPTSSYMDPYTGASRYSGASQSTTAPTSAAPFQPVTNPVPFKQANVPAMQAKLFQFNDDLRNEISTSSLAMYPDEIHLIDEAFTYLTQTLAIPPIPPTVSLSVNHTEAIMQILDRWPSSQRFPVIDLSRLVICFRAGVSSGPVIRERLIHCLFKASEWDDAWSLPLSKAKQTNILLLLRTLANGFQEGAPIDEGSWVYQIFEKLGNGPYEAFSKPQRVAIATILFNFSCVNARTPVASNVRSLYLTILLGVLRAETTDSEAAYRALVALGNTVHTAKAQNSALDRTQSAEIKEVVSNVRTTFSEDRVRNAFDGIIALV